MARSPGEVDDLAGNAPSRTSVSPRSSDSAVSRRRRRSATPVSPRSATAPRSEHCASAPGARRCPGSTGRWAAPQAAGCSRCRCPCRASAAPSCPRRRPVHPRGRRSRECPVEPGDVVPQPHLVQLREGRHVVDEVVAVDLTETGHVLLPAGASPGRSSCAPAPGSGRNWSGPSSTSLARVRRYGDGRGATVGTAAANQGPESLLRGCFTPVYARRFVAQIDLRLAVRSRPGSAAGGGPRRPPGRRARCLRRRWVAVRCSPAQALAPDTSTLVGPCRRRRGPHGDGAHLPGDL